MIASSERYEIDTSDAEHWLDADSLRPVHALNEYFLSLLAAEPLRSGGGPRLRLAVELREQLARLDVEARRRAAHCPIALVDAGFRDETLWADAIAGVARPTREEPPLGSFPHLSAIRLAGMTLNLASTAAQLDLQRACLVFGMTPTCARLVSELTLPALESLAERHADWVRPRWEDRPDLWRTLLDLAERPPPITVPSIGIRAMQLQLGELALATPICAATRQICR